MPTPLPIPTIFLDRDGVINQDKGYLHRIEDLEILPGSAEAIRDLKEAGFLCVVITNQSAVARGICSEEEIHELHREMVRRVEQVGGRIDKILYCPHYPPNQGVIGDDAYVKECPCRKPLPGMLEEAAELFPIDRPRSWIIGDSTSDIEAGRRFGVRTILVETGYAGRDGKCEVEPDFRFRDLADAARFILGDCRQAG